VSTYVAGSTAECFRPSPRRTLPLDLAAARILAAYRVPEHAPFDDALNAAVAQANDKIVVTRNTRHFEPLGVHCLDPWNHR
jgi:predicted nucleic acid-binding protein